MLYHHNPHQGHRLWNFRWKFLVKDFFLLFCYENNLNSSQVKIEYKFSKSFRSESFSKDENHAESEQFLWPFNYIQSNYKTIIQ